MHPRQQLLNPFTAPPKVREGTDQVDRRAVERRAQVAQGVHAPSVLDETLEMEGIECQEDLAIAGNSCGQDLPVDLAMAVSMALARANMGHKEAAGLMGITPGQWSKQLRGVDQHQISFQKLMKLGRPFRRALWALLAEIDGLVLAHQDIADATVLRVADLMQGLASLAVQLRALRRAG